VIYASAFIVFSFKYKWLSANIYLNAVKMSDIDINLTTITSTQILRERKNQHTISFLTGLAYSVTELTGYVSRLVPFRAVLSKTNSKTNRTHTTFSNTEKRVATRRRVSLTNFEVIRNVVKHS